MQTIDVSEKAFEDETGILAADDQLSYKEWRIQKIRQLAEQTCNSLAEATVRMHELIRWIERTE